MRRGYGWSDLTIQANYWDNLPDDNEFIITGTYFTKTHDFVSVRLPVRAHDFMSSLLSFVRFSAAICAPISLAVRGLAVGGAGSGVPLADPRAVPPVAGGGVPNICRTPWLNSRCRSRHIRITRA